jgi:hypothetical protein
MHGTCSSYQIHRIYEILKANKNLYAKKQGVFWWVRNSEAPTRQKVEGMFIE